MRNTLARCYLPSCVFDNFHRFSCALSTCLISNRLSLILFHGWLAVFKLFTFIFCSGQYVVLGPRGPWSATFPNWFNICSLNKIRQKTNVSDDLLISLLRYDEVFGTPAVSEGAEFKFVDRQANLSFLKCLLLLPRKLHSHVYLACA